MFFFREKKEGGERGVGGEKEGKGSAPREGGFFRGGEKAACVFFFIFSVCGGFVHHFLIFEGVRFFWGILFRGGGSLWGKKPQTTGGLFMGFLGLFCGPFLFHIFFFQGFSPDFVGKTYITALKGGGTGFAAAGRAGGARESRREGSGGAPQYANRFFPGRWGIH
eukprot:FR736648.1.p1 GENE.FR736648.1~~FR736648.1.p1  ORF type:complete len:165 (-),score=57.48 FR736648.1:905-1399(-)